MHHKKQMTIKLYIYNCIYILKNSRNKKRSGPKRGHQPNEYALPF